MTMRAESVVNWQRDLLAVWRGQLAFADLYRRHGIYVGHLARPWARMSTEYMSHDDYRQEIWETVAEAIRSFDENHPKQVPISGWVGYRIRQRMKRIGEKSARAAAAMNGVTKATDKTDQTTRRSKRYRYLDYMIVEERVVVQRAKCSDGMVVEPAKYELVTHATWERSYDAGRMALAAVQAAPNARAANLIAKIIAGAEVKTAAPGVFKKCRRPNKAAHRAIAQARAAVENAVSEQPSNELTSENDNQPDQETKLLPIVKVRRSHAGQRGETLVAG